CEQITEAGYYIIDNDNVFSCKIDDTLKCDKETIKTETSETVDCSNKNGQLMIFGSQLLICLSEDKYIEISSNSGNYVVKGASIQFGIEENAYAIINVNENYVKLNTQYRNNLAYIYVNILCDNPSTTYKIMDKNASCPQKSDGNFNFDNILELFC
ncbi:hypothetical protein U3516DRAFT_497836, partial [Neocallimastix sp. 'constans']